MLVEIGENDEINGHLEERRKGMEAGRAAMTIQDRRLGTALATSSFFEPNICWKIPPRGPSTTGGTSSRTARVRGEVKREKVK